MSIAIVGKFQADIYKKLKNNQSLTKEVKQVYFNLALNSEYPFIVINISDIKNLTKFEQFIYEIKFEIFVYSKDKTQNALSKIADIVIDTLKPWNAEGNNYLILAMRAQNLTFDKSNDLLTTKLIINFQTLITSQNDIS